MSAGTRYLKYTELADVISSHDLTEERIVLLDQGGYSIGTVVMEPQPVPNVVAEPVCVNPMMFRPSPTENTPSTAATQKPPAKPVAAQKIPTKPVAAPISKEIGHPNWLTAVERRCLIALLGSHPKAGASEICSRMEARTGRPISHSTVERYRKRK